MAKIFWAGDSTVKQNSILTYPQTGIGQALPLYLKKEILICNHAENGRSTKSFIEEGRLQEIEKQIAPGDYLFIQFGHNDAKIEDPTRYTDPATTYKANLQVFIGVANAAGAQPVLITPLERRCFEEDGTLGEGGHQAYVAAMKQLAAQEAVPLIDLYAASRDILQQAGAVGSKPWYMQLAAGQFPTHPDGLEDNTHLQPAGAVVFANCIAKGLQALGGNYAALLVEGY